MKWYDNTSDSYDEAVPSIHKKVKKHFGAFEAKFCKINILYVVMCKRSFSTMYHLFTPLGCSVWLTVVES